MHERVSWRPVDFRVKCRDINHLWLPVMDSDRCLNVRWLPVNGSQRCLDVRWLSIDDND